MNSIAGSQTRTFLALLDVIRPHISRDRNLPARIQQSITKEKRFGSRDRRLYRELLYTALRFWPWFEEIEQRSVDDAVAAVVWMAAPTLALAPLKTALGERFGVLPDSVQTRASILGVTRPLLPDWVANECPEAAISPEIDVLHQRAPLWLRLNPNGEAETLREFETLGWAFRRSELLPQAIEILGEVDVTKTVSFARGHFEVQDLGSQLVLKAIPIQANSRWLDACAGAGGKTLQLAQMVGAAGRVVAHDIRTTALDELFSRAQRSRISNIDSTLAANGTFDGVLVDAPCSGSGTWRRSPHLKWVTTPATIAENAALQLKLLTQFARYVRPAGSLVYVTCSLCRSENAEIVRAFSEQNPDFQIQTVEADRTFTGKPVGGGVQFFPSGHDGDGFFVARFIRTSSLLN